MRYQCAKNYENIMRFYKVIEKIIRVQFFWPHSVVLSGKVVDRIRVPISVP